MVHPSVSKQKGAVVIEYVMISLFALATTLTLLSFLKSTLKKEMKSLSPHESIEFPDF